MKIDYEDIDAEQNTFEATNRAIKFRNQRLFPLYSLPASRDFERLLFYLFKNTKQKTTNPYNDVRLLQGTNDHGRDIQLNATGYCVGIIQCKKYKQRLNESQDHCHTTLAKQKAISGIKPYSHSKW